MRVQEVLPCGTLMLHLVFFTFFSLNFYYCYSIDHNNLFLLSYKFSIFYLFLLSIFYGHPIDHSNFFLLLYQIWFVHYKMDYLLKVDQTL